VAAAGAGAGAANNALNSTNAAVIRAFRTSAAATLALIAMSDSSRNWATDVS
jgi:hypothetical protein